MAALADDMQWIGEKIQTRVQTAVAARSSRRRPWLAGSKGHAPLRRINWMCYGSLENDVVVSDEALIVAVEFLTDYNEHRATFGDKPIEYIITIIACFVLIGIPFILWWHFSVRFDHLWVENDNIIHEQGIFSRDRVEIQIRTIRSVRLAQTFLQRFTGVGTMFITSSGSAPEIVARGMPKARALRALLMGHPSPV